ncbi:unnamed protein product [Polarella glacialis]|uniref:Uncharacterized protein n=1 Tax=Polarella glacialis TaxID=89957 RepID=A0A813L7H0_POLGL|nr:unnamed protein product [Polarella glacialis]
MSWASEKHHVTQMCDPSALRYYSANQAGKGQNAHHRKGLLLKAHSRVAPESASQASYNRFGENTPSLQKRLQNARNLVAENIRFLIKPAGCGYCGEEDGKHCTNVQMAAG